MEQRLNHFRKDIVEFLASRERVDVVAELEKRNILREDEIFHFVSLDQQVQSYNYLIDAVLTAGHARAKKFYDYLLETDVTI